MDQTPTEKSSIPIIVGIVALVLVVGGFFYTQNTKSTGDTVVSPVTTDTESTETPSERTAMVAGEETVPSGEETEDVVAETKPSTDSVSVESNTEVTLPVVSTTQASQYKNGTYSAVGDYRSPEGPETIGIKLTVKNNLIVDAVATLQARDKKSVKYQELFINNFKTLVVGKKLSEVNLSKVSGSSLTPKGFNEAVVEIRGEAKV